MIFTLPYVFFRKSERHGYSGSNFWLEGPSPAFHILLGTISLLDEYVEVPFGNISRCFGCDVNLGAYKFPPPLPQIRWV